MGSHPASTGCVERSGTRHLASAVLLLVMGALATAGPARSAEVRSFDISRNGQTYRLHSDIALSAHPARVREVLSRYERIPQLDPDITEVTLLGHTANGSIRMRLAASQCLVLLCVRYRWTQDVRTLPSGDILAVIVPGDGDIQSGWIRYGAVPDGDRTRLLVDADVDASGIPLPAYLAAPWLQARLRDEALETAQLVERAARARSPASRETTSVSMPIRQAGGHPTPVNALAM